MLEAHHFGQWRFRQCWKHIHFGQWSFCQCGKRILLTDEASANVGRVSFWPMAFPPVEPSALEGLDRKKCTCVWRSFFYTLFFFFFSFFFSFLFFLFTRTRRPVRRSPRRPPRRSPRRPVRRLARRSAHAHSRTSARTSAREKLADSYQFRQNAKRGATISAS